MTSPPDTPGLLPSAPAAQGGVPEGVRLLGGVSQRTKDPRQAVADMLRVALIAGGIILAIWVLSDVILMIFLAVLIAAMIRGLSDWLVRYTRMPDWLALTIVTLTLAVLVCGVGWWVGPRFVSEGQQLWKQLSGQFSNLSQRFGGILTGGVDKAGGKEGGGFPLSGPVTTLATSTVGVVGAVLVIVAAGIYLAVAPRYYQEGAVRLFPIPYRERARQVMTDLGHTMQWWLLGQLVDMVVVGMLAGIGLWLLGIKLALALAVVAGLFTFVPYFGPIVSAIPAIIVAATVSFTDVFWVVGIYLACHAVEGYVVAPLVQRRTVELPPALTIISMMILTVLFGTLGLIVATPVVAVVLALVREVYIGNILGDWEHVQAPHGHKGPAQI